MLGACDPYEKLYVVSLNNQTDDSSGVEFWRAGEVRRG